jgi:hypothetical protein
MVVPQVKSLNGSERKTLMVVSVESQRLETSGKGL